MNTRRLVRQIFTLLLFIAVSVVGTGFADACPTCKAAMAGDEHLIRGYFWSIIFMMSMPFLLLSSFGSYFYYLVRKARAGEEMAKSESLAAVGIGNPFESA